MPKMDEKSEKIEDYQLENDNPPEVREISSNYCPNTGDDDINDYSRYIIIEGNHRSRTYIRNWRIFPVSIIVGVVPKGELEESVETILSLIN